MRDGAMKVFKYLPTKYVYKVAHPNNGVYPIPRCTFEDLEEHIFEDRMFFIPKNYDEFLRKRYGDYMQIPKDKTKHSDSPDVFIKFDECYENYWS
jgi:lipopolysaccharide cholinephosphotransferase